MKVPGKNRPSVLITAGPTREKLDPVRFISNYSTGTFGYELAREALRRGHRVVLISGPTHLDAPKGAKLVRIESALEMRKAVMSRLKQADYIIMAAAVSDWRPVKASYRKIKRSSNRISVEMVENPDILSEIGMRKAGRVVAGFALETENLEKNAIKKLLAKNADIIVANGLKKKVSVFGNKAIDIVIIDRLGNKTSVKGLPKKDMAKIILDKIFAFNI